ncbi:MAG: ankyrin repeat domain-containing protein [Betaproteobacteria bacterium]|nr:ankyrin repeat domain-containing protein [Betaproteobacteria bacterium]
MKKLVAIIGLFLISSSVLAGAYKDFFHAIQIDNARDVQRLLERGFDPNTLSEEGVPGLLKATQEHSFKVAEVLLDHPKTAVDPRSERNESPLMLAALRGQETLVHKLVARGAEVNKSGWTPLHYAATAGHTRICAFLIGAQAEVDAGSPNGTTPLMMAAQYGHAGTVKLLLESGADPAIRNAQGLSALEFARRAGRADSADLIQQVLARQARKPD